MLRLLIAAPLAAALALSLFYSLALLTSMDDRLVEDTLSAPNLDFMMLRQESDVELRKRQLPPEPEEVVQQQQPKMPPMQSQPTPNVSSEMPNIDVPNIDASVQISLSPSLNNLAAPAPAPTPPAPVISVDTNPTVLSQVPPRYPQRALRRRQQGQVLVEFTVTEAGSVQPDSIKIIESTPPGVFDKTVLRALPRWRFKTRIQDGKPVKYRARQKLEFKLEK